jgi:hypothetical protein
MNFRFLYFWTSASSKDIDHHLLAALLDLRHLPSWRPTDKQPDLMSEIGQIWSNGWVTASVLHPSDSRDEELQPVDVLQAAFGLCHAQWFLCQIWISTYMKVVTNKNWQSWSRATVQKYTDHLYSLERDLTEVANLDVMLRDPRLIRLSQFFLEQLGVSRHLDDAKTRVSLLTQYLRGHLEIQTSRAASRLQVLFSFSAAAAIAGLVQPIWPLWPVKTVVWVISLLCLTLFVAFSFRWASVRRVLLGVESNARKGAEAVHDELADQLALITRLRRPPSSTGAPAGTRSTHRIGHNSCARWMIGIVRADKGRLCGFDRHLLTLDGETHRRPHHECHPSCAAPSHVFEVGRGRPGRGWRRPWPRRGAPRGAPVAAGCGDRESPPRRPRSGPGRSRGRSPAASRPVPAAGGR